MRPYSQSIGIYYYEPGGAFSSPEQYARAQKLEGADVGPLTDVSTPAGPGKQVTLTRRSTLRLHSGETELRRERIVLIPRRGGFYAVVYSSPDKDFASGEPVLAGVLASLTFPL
jgi:hypothetical protein